MKQFLNFAVAALAAALLLSPPSLLAQYERRQPQPEIPRENIQCSGTVKQVGRGVIGIATDAGEQWAFQLEAARPQDITFSGQADASFVKPGMWIRFTTKLTRRGDAQEPITNAEVYTPREGFGVGIYPEGAGEIGGGEGGGNLFAPTEEKPKPKAKAEPKVRDEDVVYRVGGQVSRISRLGELTISAGGTSVKAKLAEDAKISVDVTDLSFLQAGDKVEVRGWYPAGTKGRGVATQVTASAALPLTDASKKKKPVPTAEKPAADGDNEPKADKPAEGAKKEGENKAEEKKEGDKPAPEKKDE